MRLLTVALLAGFVTSPVIAQGTIKGTKHDFSAATWNTGTTMKPGEICGVCHIPHVEGRVAGRTGQSFLWGRETTTVTYTLYTSNSIDGVLSQPGGTTKLCLGCHDGSVALEQFHLSTTTTTYIPAASLVPTLGTGTSFAADHPVSITYLPASDPGLRAVTTNFPGTVAGQTIADILDGGSVECMSCHDPHNVEVPTGVGKFLRIKNDDPANPSALCLACHIK